LAVPEIFNHSDTSVVPSMCDTVGLLILLKLCPVFTFLQQLMTQNCELFTHTLVFQCSPSTLYLLTVGLHYCVMRFAYVLHIRQQNLILFSCLYIELFGLVIEVIFHYCTTPPCHKIDLFKRPFRASLSEHLDDAPVLLDAFDMTHSHI